MTGKIIQTAFGRTAGFWLFLYKFLFKPPLILTYATLRKIKKIIFQLSGWENFSQSAAIKYFFSLVLLLGFGFILTGYNINAQDLRSDHYGTKSLLYKLTPATGEEDSGLLDEELQEGPLNFQPTSGSYIRDVMEPGNQPADYGNGYNTLISPTQDESALISPEITDITAVVKKRDKIIDYIVQPGDSLSVIAARFGISVNTILWENSLTANSLIRGGQTLKILPVSGVAHKVAKGESLKAIANKYKVEVGQILEFNKMESADQVQIGQLLIIPGGVKAAVKVSPASGYATGNITTPKTPAQISAAKLQWPTTSYRITQYFRARHTGIDIGNKVGQATYAAEDGIVEKAGWNAGGYGYYIIINHGNGMRTLYGHHSKLYVISGQRVARGQVIGAIGSTGRSTGPHLHFEVYINGRRVNPLGYIR